MLNHVDAGFFRSLKICTLQWHQRGASTTVVHPAMMLAIPVIFILILDHHYRLVVFFILV